MHAQSETCRLHSGGTEGQQPGADTLEGTLAGHEHRTADGGTRGE